MANTKAKHEPLKFSIAKDLPIPATGVGRPGGTSPLVEAVRGLEIGSAIVIDNPRKSSAAHLHGLAKKLGIKLAVRALDNGKLGAWRVEQRAS